MQAGRDILIRIKRAIIAGRFVLTVKAEIESERDGLTKSDVAESILTAGSIAKILRSTSPRGMGGEKLYVILGTTLDGVVIYSKGKLIRELGQDYYYFLISAKRAL